MDPGLDANGKTNKERTVKKGLLSLLASRRFGPFFFTQFLGAFNDNVFRQALILLIASGAVTAVSVNTLNNVALALFILPFFLFSALAGQGREQEERQNEQGQGHVVQGVDADRRDRTGSNQQYQRLAKDIVVEGAEKLGKEERPESA